MQKAGLLTGADEAMAKMTAQHQAKTGDKFIHITKHGITTDAAGMHLVNTEDSILTKHRAGKAFVPKLTPAAMREFGVTIKDRELAQRNPMEYMFTRLIPAMERFNKWAPGSFLDDKSKLTDTDRAVGLSAFLPGTRATLLNLIADLTIYHKRIEAQGARMGKAPGVDKLVDAEDQTKVRLEKLSTAWEAFNVKLFTNSHVIDALNKSFDTLTNGIRIMTQYIDPVINFFARIAYWADQINKATTGQTGPADVASAALQSPTLRKIATGTTGIPFDPPGIAKAMMGGVPGVVEGIVKTASKLAPPFMGLPAIGQTNEKLGSQGFIQAPPAMAMEVDKYGNLDTASMLKLAGAGYGTPATAHPAVQPAASQKPAAGNTTMNFNFGHVFGTDQQDLAKKLYEMVQPAISRDQRKTAHNASYQSSGGGGYLNSPHLAPAGKQ
jgi:hypothetical protein